MPKICKSNLYSGSVKLLDAEARIERLDGEHAAAFDPEHQKPVDADAVRRQELRPPAEARMRMQNSGGLWVLY
jgi:hypothetical protein